MSETPESLPVGLLGLVLFTACLVAIVCRRLRLPYSVGLLAAGAALAVMPFGVQIPLSRELIFGVFLPPLVFEAALQLRWNDFRRELPATLLLAFPGVAIAGAAVTLGAHLLLGWSWLGAAFFGVLIAATDPVSVIAAFKEMSVQPRLKLLVESESLLNDGAAAVGFSLLIAAAAGGSGSALAVAGSFVWIIAGGVLTGACVAALLLLIAGRTTDHLVEITLTTLAAYGSFLLAERIGGSGVLASLTAGLIVGNVGWMGAISDEGRGHVMSFWDYAAFLANSAVFLMIGGQEAHQPFERAPLAVVVSIPLVLLGRALAVYPLCAVLRPTPLRAPLAYQHILFWGGLRGALGLALALALPASIPERGEVILVAFAVVAFSVVGQGLTMPWLIKRLGLRQDDVEHGPG